MSVSCQASSPTKPLIEPSEDASLFISHELRTPLASLQGALGLISTGHFGELSDQGQALLAAAMRSADRLTRLAGVIEKQPYTMQSLLSAEDMGALKMENEFTSIFDLDDFCLWYQPIVAVPAQRIVGFEALARWRHPTQGWIAPSIFVPLAEKTGLIHQLGLDLLHKACRALKTWQQTFSDITPFTLSVNLSTVQLRDPHLFEKIRAILEKVGIEPTSLALEITESTFIENNVIAQGTLRQLQHLGIQLYLDDFGTGYSSLARLQDLPLNTLKIDRAFVLTRNWTISEAVIKLAAKLKLDVIAEGIETVEDLQTLQAMGCEKIQGYLFSKPVDDQLATNLLLQQRLKQQPARCHLI
ncbi:MAG: EAL domain-containing protein [Leptolyngbya sp. RL_3_1]|nr:EAL domain-containing protein [Leptolyngbya sp. RL_3_1]